VVDAGSTQDELLYDLGVERSEINAAQASKKAYSSSQQCLMFNIRPLIFPSGYCSP
jgi:hypothetical protein